MGNFLVTIDYNKISRKWLKEFRAMKFSHQEIKDIYDIFNQLDVNQLGGIDIDQWLTFLQQPRNSFMERCFCSFDQSDSHLMNFYEFVVSCWKFCTLNDTTMRKSCKD